MDQSQAPILDALRDFYRQDMLPFTTPGHKMGRGVDEYTTGILGRDTFLADISELAGFDDAHESKGIQTQAEQLAAELYGADQCFFSTNGSSLSAHSALMSVAGPGDKVLFARNIHKSVVASIILAGVDPVWLYPPVDDCVNFQHGVTPDQVEQALGANPDAKAVFVVSPSYLGVGLKLKEIADVCHRYGVPLLVDEAWGPHFPFHPDFPPFAMECGADLSLGSVHKTMNGVQQASIICARKGYVDLTRAMLCFDLLETTSTCSLITGSIDGARRYMALQGEQVWGKALELSRCLRRAAGSIPGIRVFGEGVLRRPEVAGLDETKVTLDVSELGVTGIQAADWLRAEHRITVELANQRLLLFMVSLGDTEGTIGRAVTALQVLPEWAATQTSSGPTHITSIADAEPQVAMRPRDAILGPVRTVPLDSSVGEIAAEMISPYPPGIPAIAPGEVFTQPIVDFLHAVQELQLAIPDAGDPSLKNVRVVAKA